MKKETVFGVFGSVLLAATLPFPLAAAEPGTSVSVVVTAEAKRDKTMPPLVAEDISVSQGRDRRPITSLESLADTKLQLLLMIDDSASTGFDAQIRSLKDFVLAQPANVHVAVGYMRNGMTQMTAEFTPDHAAAAKAIRVANGPGGGDVSPYDSLVDVLKKWPSGQAPRREIVMISSGIEGLGGGFAPDNPYVNAGITAAQKAGAIVYTIYNPGSGHDGHSFWRANWGQNFLAQLSDETGGEFFALGFGSAVSFDPYFKAILEAEQHQYRLTFLAATASKSELQPVQIKVIEKDASLAAPNKVFVPAGR